MARPKRSGWQLRNPDGKRTTYSVRFTLPSGKQREVSTGKSNAREASEAAARIYADEIAKALAEPPRPKPAKIDLDLAVLADKWIESLRGSLDEETLAKGTTTHARHFLRAFDGVREITTAAVQDYVSERLGKVTAATVRKELSSLRGFIEWLQAHGHLAWDVVIKSPGKRALGTRASGGKKPSIFISPEEAFRILDLVPEYSRHIGGKAHPIRAYYVFAYETGLRPAFLQALSVPEHWTPDRPGVVTITAEFDKNRESRTHPLTKRAQEILKKHAPKEGIVFGDHDRIEAMRNAAQAVLGEARAKLFSPWMLRSAFVTHLLAAGATPFQAQSLAGHSSLATTARYAKIAGADAAAGLALFEASSREALKKFQGGVSGRRRRK